MKKFISLLTVIIILIAVFDLHAGYFKRGKTYYIYKKYDKAKEMFLKTIESYEHGDSYYFLGEIEKLQENYKEAMKYYQKAAILNTTKKYKKNAFWNLVVLAEMSGDYDNLVKTCKYLWEKHSDHGARKKIEKIINKSLWTNNAEAIAKYKEGINLKKKKKIEQAMERFRESINLAPSFLAPKFEIGINAYNNSNISMALEHLEEIASRISFYADVHLIIGDIHYNNRNYSSAINHFNKAIDYGFFRKKTKNLIKLKRGTSYYNEGDLENARIDIEDTVKYNKKSIESLEILSAIYIKLKDYDEALKTLLKTNRLKKDNPIIIYKIGSIYYKKNNRKYITYFDRLFDLTIKNSFESGKKYSKAFLILVKKHFENKNYNRVINIYSSMPENYPDYKIILITAKTYYLKRNFDKAIDLFEKLSLNNEEKYILCKAYFRSGRIDQAKEILKVLIYNSDYYNMAKTDKYLKKILMEIENDRIETKKSEPVNNKSEEIKSINEINEKNKGEAVTPPAY